MRALHWFRSDLRLRDNRVIEALAERADEWAPVFVLDPRFLGSDPTVPRVRFLLDCVRRLRAELEERGVALHVEEGRAESILPALARRVGAEIVSFGSADTPLARRRDDAVTEALERADVTPLVVRDHTVFGPDEIRTQADGVYSVFTPYRNAWWRAWEEAPRHASLRTDLPAKRFEIESEGAADPTDLLADPDPDGMRLPTGGEAAARRRLKSFLDDTVARYETDRDLPAVDGTSRLSPYLRFGVISPRVCFDEALEHAKENTRARDGVSKWLDELVWREFYAMLLAHHPESLFSNHRSEYDALDWRDSDDDFDAWRAGRTGYPIVDAGMRQLATTGWMHNRVRMIVASFLTKDLLIDWRRGARHFFERLVDGDPASNSGGWQWAASTGTDAQPYFRIFNPVSQGRKWDPDGEYVRRFVPELEGLSDREVHEPWRADSPPKDYPAPIVDHAEARERALEAYRAARAVGDRS